MKIFEQTSGATGSQRDSVREFINNLDLNFTTNHDFFNQQSNGKRIQINHRMKFPFCFINSTIIASAILFTGCATTPKTTQITGQILVSDNGKIQKTGLAPIWIYDATNIQLTANIPLPDFGGRSRKDLTRIRANYPGVLTVCSNYQAVMDKFAPAEMKYENLNQKYSDMKNALHGQTNGPDFDAVKQLLTTA